MSGLDKQRHVLHTLAQDGDVKLLQQALKSNSPNQSDADGMLPLHYASWYGHPLCCQALLAANAEVDAFDHDGASPLHAASYNGQMACVVLLVESGASALVSDNENQTPKDAATAEKHIDVVNFLRVVEEDQRRQSTLARNKQLFIEAEAHATAYKVEVLRATKEAKKKVGLLEKDAKRIRKETISALKRNKKAGRSGPAAGTPSSGPESFSKLAMNGSGGPGARSSAPASLGSKPRRTSNNSTPTTSKPRAAAEPAGAGQARPLPAVPQVSNEIKAEMVLAEFESDGDGTEGMIAFLGSIDLKEFARLLTKSQMTLEKLQQSSVQDLKRLGLPAGAQKKIYSALHPQ